MTEPTDLDAHRGMMAQVETEQRRQTAELKAELAARLEREAELEEQMLAAPSADLATAAAKARYLLELFAISLAGSNQRREELVATVIADLDRLLAESSPHSLESDGPGPLLAWVLAARAGAEAKRAVELSRRPAPSDRSEPDDPIGCANDRIGGEDGETRSEE